MRGYGIKAHAWRKARTSRGKHPSHVVYFPHMPDYVIGSGLTENQLKAASFWVRHRIGLRRLGYASLITLTSGLWLFNLWHLLDAYAISYPRESRIPALILQNQLTMASFESAMPQPVIPSNVSIFANTDGRQDFLTELVNPNADWWAEFTYAFDTGTGKTPGRNGFILPDGRAVLTQLGWKGDAPATAATLSIDQVRWHRVDPLAVDRSYPQFQQTRLNMEIKDVTYRTDVQIDSKPIGQTQFTLTNHSGYGFWNLDLAVILYRAETPVATTRITLAEVRPGETRPVTVNWPDQPSGISRTEIVPQVNILDPKTFLPSSRLTP